MRLTRTKALVAGAVLALTATACGGNAGSDDSKGIDVKVDKDAAANFDDGTRMKELADSGKITVGVKYDQPGLGFKDAASKVPSGFDIEVAKILVASLGIDPDNVKWEETISDNREPYLQAGKVDLVLASYSITPDRRKVVGQTGPYMLTGQQVLVQSDSKVKSIADLKGKEVCSAQGSTSLDQITEAGAVGVPADNYGSCAEDVLSGEVPAMSTDGSILLGLAAQHEGKLKVVGEPFSEERIGVGYSKKYPEMCEWINTTLQKAFDDGTWEKAFDVTLGKSGEDAPEPPTLDKCQA